MIFGVFPIWDEILKIIFFNVEPLNSKNLIMFWPSILSFGKKTYYFKWLTILYFLGGGSAGCNVLYQLAKKNVKAVLLERAQVTSGSKEI